jgi:pimeloyl-ACP methyl ester carboxylesterase
MRGVFLMVHGYRSCGFDDFCGAVQNMTRDGFGCMVIDQRAHGLSEGNTICFGVREREDVREWALFLEKEFPGMPVILDGISMGAATVMAAAALDLPENVRGDLTFKPLKIIDEVLDEVLGKEETIEAEVKADSEEKE